LHLIDEFFPFFSIHARTINGQKNSRFRTRPLFISCFRTCVPSSRLQGKVGFLRVHQFILDANV
jgi:hypothetical protein